MTRPEPHFGSISTYACRDVEPLGAYWRSDGKVGNCPQPRGIHGLEQPRILNEEREPSPLARATLYCLGHCSELTWVKQVLRSRVSKCEEQYSGHMVRVIRGKRSIAGNTPGHRFG